MPFARARMDIARRRLAAQHLTRAPFATVTALVHAQGAVQAQDFGAAKWALGLRCRGATDAAMDVALAEGTILRTHVLRPTWHFVLPADIRWMLRLTAPRIAATMAPYDRQLGLDAAVIRRSNAALARALAGGVQLTRASISTILARSRLPVDTISLAHLLMRAELDEVVCSGPRTAKQFTYALFDERVPPSPELGRDESLAELTRRYFTARGPATPRDFAWWSGLTVADARRGIEAVGEALEASVIDGIAYWAPSAKPAVRQPSSPSAHLLPNYDEYFIGYRDRGAILERAHAARAMGSVALTAHVIEVDGQVVGGWRRTAKKGLVTVELHPVVRLSAAERDAVAIAAERYGAFLELPVAIDWKSMPAARVAPGSGWQRGVLR